MNYIYTSNQWQMTGKRICKRIRPLIFAVFVIFAIIAKADVYEHRYFNATFPDMAPKHFEVIENDYIEKLTYQDDRMKLKITVFPLSFNTVHTDLIVREIGTRLSGYEDAIETTICGRKMIKISSAACESDSTLTFSNLYLLSNGEVTLMVGESGSNDSVDWWSDNIDLKINDRPTRTLSERTSDFEDFFNKAFSQNRAKMKITHDDGLIKIDIIDLLPSSLDSGELGAMRNVYKLINMFTIFEEYADLGYSISLKITDGEGNSVCDSTFSHEQYSTWNDAMFNQESAADVIDEEECHKR